VRMLKPFAVNRHLREVFGETTTPAEIVVTLGFGVCVAIAVALADATALTYLGSCLVKWRAHHFFSNQQRFIM